VQINRTTGAISALRHDRPADRPHRRRIVGRAGAARPTAGAVSAAPSTVVLDLAATAQALDLPLDPDGPASACAAS
jgi:hypothetical protein